MSDRIRSLDDFLLLLKSVKTGKDGQYMALCPGHNDKNRSLSIKQADGKLLVKCFAGCGMANILKPLNLEAKDLFLNNHKSKSEHRDIEAIYHYNGFEVVRTRPKGFYQRRSDSKGGYIKNLQGVKLSLYHQNELKQAIDSGKAVYVVEGEKDADNLYSIGLTATTNPMGAGKWRDSYSQALKDADLVIIPDRDKPGRAHAEQVAKSCYGIAKRIRVLELPNGSKDVSDWLEGGETRQGLERLSSEALDWKPKGNGVSLVCLAGVKPETVSWLWSPYIPRGKLTLLEGDPGIGKSWVSLAIAASVSLGKGLPGVETIESASVVLASAEDGLGDTIRPRLDAMGADVSKVHAIKGALDFGNEGLVILEEYVERVCPSLVIIDPLVAYIGVGVDIHRANETRAVMAKLADIAEEHGCAILVIRHLTKSGALKAIYRGIGSIDFAAACRSMLLVGCDPGNEWTRGIVQIKSSLAVKGQAIGFELRDGSFYWTGESDLTAARILAAEDTGDGKSARDEAAEFLRDELRNGPVEARQVWEHVKKVGLSEATVKRAKSMLGVITQRHGETGKRGGGNFTWELPDLGSRTDLEYQGYPIKGNDTLNNSGFKNTPLLKIVDPLNTPDVLGMPIEKALELWRSEGAPLIHLGPSENCEDLEKLLPNPNVNPEHLQAVRAWLDKVLKGRGER